jgi:hypothetical protein
MDKNIDETIVNLKNQITEFQKLGKNYGIVEYSDSDIIETLGYISLLLKYERHCMILNDTLLPFNINNTMTGENTKNFFSNAEKISNDLLECISRGEKVIGIPLNFIIHSSELELKERKKKHNDQYHANMLIYKPYEKIIERFEPHGASYRENKYNYDTELNDILKYMFEVLMKPYLKKYTPKLKTPDEICPNLKGFQSLEGPLKKLIKEGNGFCIMWSLFILELVYANPTIKTNELIKEALKISKEDPEYILDVIRGFIIEMEKLINYYIHVLIDSKVKFKFSRDKFDETIHYTSLRNKLLNLLILTDNKSSLNETLKNKINKVFEDIATLLNKFTTKQINDIMCFLTSAKFDLKKNTKEELIEKIIKLIKNNTYPNLTKETLMNVIVEHYNNPESITNLKDDFYKLNYLLKKKSRRYINDILNMFTKENFDIKDSKNTKEELIKLIKTKSYPKLTLKSVLKYLDENHGLGYGIKKICPQVGKCKKISKCGGLRITGNGLPVSLYPSDSDSDNEYI